MIINGNKLPDFFVVGAAKSGTTTLYQILKNHPEIYCPEVKEPEHFTYKYLGKKYIIDGKKEKSVNLNYITDFSDYCNLFIDAKDDQLIGDFSTHSLYHSENFIKNLKEVYGDKIKDLKFIAILRHPVDRAISHYTMKRRDFEEPLEIMDAMDPDTIQSRLEKGYVKSFDYIGFSEYKKQVENFTRAGLSIQFYDFSLLKSSVEDLVKEVLTCLGCDDEITVKNNVVYNKSGEPTNSLTRIVYKAIIKLGRRFRPFFPKRNYEFIKRKLNSYFLIKKRGSKEKNVQEFIYRKIPSDVKFYENLHSAE